MNQQQQALRNILLTQWDPVGVKDEPAAADEYDSYVEPLAKLIADGADAEKIAQYLLRVETEMMGLSGNEARARVVAARLMEAARSS